MPSSRLDEVGAGENRPADPRGATPTPNHSRLIELQASNVNWEARGPGRRPGQSLQEGGPESRPRHKHRTDRVPGIREPDEEPLRMQAAAQDVRNAAKDEAHRDHRC